MTFCPTCLQSRRHFLMGGASIAAAASLPGLTFGAAAATKPGKLKRLKTARRCATPDPNKAILRRSIATARARPESAGGLITELRVPVIFHVLHHGETAYVSESRLAQQLQQLNADFRSARVTFELDAAEYSDEESWYLMAPAELAGEYELPDVEAEVKTALGRDRERALNVYVAEIAFEGLLGWATFPWQIEDNMALDGVVIGHQTIPDPAQADAPLGRTLTHEVGHWLGLLHTFQNGCEEPGDGVEDTPFQAEPTSGCPRSEPSCPNSEEPDPVANFMNYSDDSCMQSFTDRQVRRIHALSAVFRPKLVRAVATDLPVAREPSAPSAPSAAEAPPAAAPVSAPAQAAAPEPVATPGPANPADAINDLLNPSN